MVADKLATLKQGARTDLSPIGEKSQAEAAALLNIGKRSVERAHVVHEHGAAELVAAVERGQVSVSAAVGIAALPEDQQREILASIPRREIMRAAKVFMAERAAEKKEHRAEREAELGRRQTALPDKKYGVLYVDPPWRFEVWSRETGLDMSSADDHYPTLTIEQIKAINVPSIAADDAVLFLWATIPMLPQTLEVMRAWNFEYKSACIWSKDRSGTGYWFLNRNEILLVGTRGKIPAPAPGTQFESEIRAPRAEHSAKPAAFREMIEAYFPTLPKIEMFARGQAAPGWAVHGNEAEQ